ncbi:unnamed protein product [Rotaria sp. Silwood1]|nr:unnamed protein product [Rotaria sp. Silwood1]CAF4929686.1 unnamed protein product [Rotaria sp. Silwood1]CAF5141084.1 unnamed protein product [Rotaria sp. Silwood1]
MQRVFRVPFGSWLIPIIGSLLCILLMTGITKPTCYRFLVWTAIGQIIYFSYGFRNSQRRRLRRTESNADVLKDQPPVAIVMEEYVNNGFEADLASTHTENVA